MNRIIEQTQKYLLASFCLATVTFCSTASADVKVFACEPEWAALAKELGGDNVETFAATTGKQDPHQVQARPSLISHMRDADLLVCSGADLEVGWLPLLLRRAGNSQLNPGGKGYFLAADHVKLLGVPKVIDRSQGDVHAAGNPHVQTNPKNIGRIAKSLVQKMAQLDPKNSSVYQARYHNFNDRWTLALKKWKKQMQPFSHANIVVQHQSWDYLNDFADFNQVATIEEKPGIPPTSGHLASLVKQLKGANVKVIIRAAYQDGKASKWLSKRIGAPAVTLPFSIDGDEQSTNLFDLYNRTFNLLEQAMK